MNKDWSLRKTHDSFHAFLINNYYTYILSKAILINLTNNLTWDAEAPKPYLQRSSCTIKVHGKKLSAETIEYR